MTHREAIKQWLGEMEFTNQDIIDWGSGSKPASRYISHFGCVFTTIDKNKLIASDRRSGNHKTHDIQTAINLGEYDVAFCIEVLEHIQRPELVIQNIYNNLKIEGKLYMSVPFMFPIHSEDDYYRYTEHGLRYLLRDFKDIKIKNTIERQGYLVEARK